MARHGAHGRIACTPDARCVSDMERLRQRAQGEKRSAQITRSGMGYQGARPARHGIASRNARRGEGGAPSCRRTDKASRGRRSSRRMSTCCTPSGPPCAL